MYTSLEHYIDSYWVKASGAKTQEVMNLLRPASQFG